MAKKIVNIDGNRYRITAEDNDIQVTRLQEPEVDTEGGVTHSPTPIFVGFNENADAIYLGLGVGYAGNAMLFLCNAKGQKLVGGYVAMVTDTRMVMMKDINTLYHPVKWILEEDGNLKVNDEGGLWV
ncbi:MAG: hypothetical protein EOM62_22095 [Bacteroidia bacterium]|nr:hypothetical protein [Bacteroidia bacterium]